MRILVTGGLGFIGHNVVAELCQRGHTVRIVDNQTDYGIIPFDELNYIMTERRKKIPANVLIHQIDIESSAVRFVFEQFKPEVIVHLASLPRQKVVNANPQLGSRVMCEGLINLLELSVKHHVDKFVYVSSSMVYGDFKVAREDTACNPAGQYAILKYTGEQLVKDYSRRTNISHIIIRPSAVYGPLDVEDRVVSKFLLGAMRGDVLQVNGEEELLDFSDVAEVAHGIAVASTTTSITWGTYNMSRGHARTLLEAARLAVKIVESGTVQVNAPDTNFPRRGKIDTGAAWRDFDWSANVDIETGFQNYYNWLLSSTYYSKQMLVHA